MCCDTSQFLALKFCVPHTKPYGVRGLSKYYHIWLYLKLGNFTYKIRQILCVCVCVEFNKVMEKPYSLGVSNTENPRYYCFVECSYWPVLGTFKNCNIIIFTNKITSREDFDEDNKVLLDAISDNVESLVYTGKYVPSG